MQFNDKQRATVGEAVRRARTGRGLSIQHVAARAPMSAVTWGKVESGQPVRLATYYAVERAVGWKPGTIDDIASGRSSNHRSPEPVVSVSESAGRHVQVRLIGEPDAVAVVFEAIAAMLATTPGGLSRSKRTPGHVVQYATTTAPGTNPEKDRR